MAIYLYDYLNLYLHYLDKLYLCMPPVNLKCIKKQNNISYVMYT
jgi:hypothetical protein